MIPILYNVRNLAARKTTTAASALGIGLVVFVLASSLMLSEGITRTLGRAGSPDTAIVLRNGKGAELSSSIEERQVGLILAAPGVKKDASGAPIGAGEEVEVVILEKVGSAGLSNVQVRGVTERVLALRPAVKLVAGRMLRPGTDEVIVGNRLRGRFRGLDIGQSLELRKNRPMRVVGAFEDGGSAFESEVWCDRESLRSAFGRSGVVSSVRVRLESAKSYEAFESFVERDKQLGMDVLREPDYYEQQSESLSGFVLVVGILIALLFSLGAMIGATVTMHASVADRQREIGTLRALGFSRFGILLSFLLEALLLALGGGTVGALAALGMGWVRFSVVNPQSWSEVVFSFSPTPASILSAMMAAAVMGVSGGFFPALRASRISPTQAMRG